MVYHQVVAKFNIWRLDLKDAKHHQRPPFAVVSEKGDKMRPDLSPDGKKIAFVKSVKQGGTTNNQIFTVKLE